MMTISWLLILKTFNYWCDCFISHSIGMLLTTIFYWLLTMVFFKKKTVFKKSFFAFISSTNKKFWNERSFTYLVVSCKWHTLSLLILWNSWNNLLVLYTCIILYFEKKVRTALVNTSSLYQQNKQPPLFQISEHKKNTPYLIIFKMPWLT